MDARAYIGQYSADGTFFVAAFQVRLGCGVDGVQGGNEWTARAPCVAFCLMKTPCVHAPLYFRSPNPHTFCTLPTLPTLPGPAREAVRCGERLAAAQGRAGAHVQVC